MKTPQCVCIVQLGKLGDMVCTTPLFSALKKAYPNIEVIVVGNLINSEILQGHPAVNSYITWDKDIFSMARKLRHLNIQFACVTGPSDEALAAFYLADIPRISCPVIKNGWSPYETRLYKILRLLAFRIPHKMGNYTPREYLHLLEPIHITTSETKKTLTYSSKALEKTKIFLTSIKKNTSDLVIGITPSAGNKIKEWPVRNWAAIADYLVEKHSAVVVVFGSENDQEKIREFMGYIKRGNIYDAGGMFSIDELKSAISQLDLFIGVDTGPVYIAEAFEVPTVDIIGSFDEHEQAPVGARHRLVIPPNRQKAELHVMNARVYNSKEAKRQIESITVPAVTHEIDLLLNTRKV